MRKKTPLPARPWVCLVLVATLGSCGDTTSALGRPVGLKFDALVESSIAGSQIPAVSVSVVDVVGSVVTNATASITVQAITTGAATATLSGTRTKSTVGGTAVFNDLSIQQPGSYTLAASAPTLAAASSNTFTVAAAVVR